MGESLRMEAMVRFCFDIELDSLLEDEYVNYGGIKIITRHKTEEEKISRFAEVYAQAKWMIEYMGMVEANKLKQSISG